MSKNSSGKYFQRLHALDLTTGAEEFGGPISVHATFAGTGDNSSSGQVIFAPKQYKERPGLLLLNGIVYTAWSSHCDHRPYTGWIIGYDELTLQQVSVLNITPDGREGSIWASGAAPAAQGNDLFVLAGNGTFDTTLNANGFPIKSDYGNGFLKVSTLNKTLTVADYFEVFNTVAESNADEDLGSGGVVVLPPMEDATGKTRHLVVGAGKHRNIYLVDSTNMGKFHTSMNTIYEELPAALAGMEFGGSAYFNNNLYYGAVKDSIRMFHFSNARLAATPASKTTHTFVFPGVTPSISASGTTSAILSREHESSCLTSL